jgi:hypothetical protein
MLPERYGLRGPVHHFSPRYCTEPVATQPACFCAGEASPRLLLCVYYCTTYYKAVRVGFIAAGPSSQSLSVTSWLSIKLLSLAL